MNLIEMDNWLSYQIADLIFVETRTVDFSALARIHTLKHNCYQMKKQIEQMIVAESHETTEAVICEE